MCVWVKWIEVVRVLRQSCTAEGNAVADLIEDIASNGEGQEQDEFLAVCLKEMIDAGKMALRILEGE